jgi:transposase
MQISTIGLDLAKSVFQIHAIDAAGEVVLRQQLRRGQLAAFFAKLPPVLVGIEACGAAHHWARVLEGLGHQVRMMPPAYVKPYLRRNKTDARDAEAICEAVQRPWMRFVPIKSVAMQAAQGLHRARDLLVRQRSQIGHCLRGLAGEFGLVAREGEAGLARLIAAIGTEDSPVPAPLRAVLVDLATQWAALDEKVAALDRAIAAEAKADPLARRLMSVPGIGPITAHAFATGVPGIDRFKSARDFAAFLGLTPRERASAGTRREGHISRAGDETLRRLLVLGAASLVRQTGTPKKPSRRPEAARARPWLTGLLARRPVKVAVVAQAAKTARIVFALMRSGDTYRAGPAAA